MTTYKRGETVRHGRDVYEVIRPEVKYRTAGYILRRISSEPGQTNMYTTWIPGYLLQIVRSES